MEFLRLMRPNAIRPMWWSEERHGKYVRFIKRLPLFLCLALLILVLSGCSKAVSIVPMPQPPANLASNCAPLSPVPQPLVDPERVIWEVDTVAKYGDCAMKHRLTVEAWQEAVKKSKK